MSRLFLIRHADPQIQVDRPSASWGLSSHGLERAQMLARRIDPRGLRCVYSSVEPKAIETALMPLVASAPDDVVVVTHGTVLTLSVTASSGVDPFPFWKTLGLPAAVILTLPAFSFERITGVD